MGRKAVTMKITSLRLPVLTALLLAPLTALQAADRLESVPNGDFEKQDIGVLAGWDPGRMLPARVPNDNGGAENLTVRFVWDSVSHGKGQGSLRADCKGTHSGGEHDSAFGIISSPPEILKVRPNTEYRLTWFYKATGLMANGEVRTVLFFHSPGPLAAPPSGSRFIGMTSDVKKTDARDWQQASLAFRTPKDVGWMQVRLEATSAEAGKKFSVWWDDFALTLADGSPPPDALATPATWTARTPPAKADASGLGGFQLSEPAVPYGSRIQRTMRLLATSTPKQRNRVKILFYGQSIIAQNWWKAIVADLRERFPNADIVAENPSIGGFMSNWLKDTMYADCYPADADLIVFHDYTGSGGPEEMKAIFDNIRRNTTAEVMPMTHHVSWIGNASYQRNHQQESDLILQWSDEFGFEAVDIRTNWQRYLDFTKSKGREFLRDIIHLSPSGEMLWTKIALPHFKYLPDAKPYWRDRIKVFSADGQPFAGALTEYPTGGALLDNPLKLSFKGTRVDLLADTTVSAKLGSATILIDGKAPSTFPELYYATTGSRPPDFFWPMIRRVEIGRNPVVEDWKIIFSKINSDGTDFEYEVTGSITGLDGKGIAKERFVSNSGRLIIEPQQFMIAALMKQARKGQPYPDGTSCTVSVRPRFLDVWKPQPPANPVSEGRYTLASGLAAATHTLEIIPNNDGLLPLRAIVVHQPIP
jgi:hypothetical protein